ncbi:MAG: NlpC/P60 family protein [Pseudomonadota bacterium]
MTDRRLTPANERVAAAHLQGQVEALSYVEGAARQLAAPFADLNRAPKGRRDRQLQRGDAVTVFEDREGSAFVQSVKDGYVGYLASDSLTDPSAPNYRVAVRSTHVYAMPNFKSDDLMALGFGAKLRVLYEEKTFFAVEGGFVPKPHLRPLEQPFKDPVTLAQLHFGSPYLWGGNTVWGLDCSGLVQAALHACDIACPGDSDMQQEAVGDALPDDAPLQRGDLIFWQGHVGMMVDAETMIHANAHHMAVAYEPIKTAIARIQAQGDGPVTARKRLR